MSAPHACPYVDAYAEWDDPHAFRVFLVTADDAEPQPMTAAGWGRDDGTIESRLYRAAFLAYPKDIAKLRVEREPIGFATLPPAKRVAGAVKKELAAIAAGKPGPSDLAIQIALATVPRRGQRG